MTDEKKQAMWLCPCGTETPQPIGPGVKFIDKCPKCGKDHERCREADGTVSRFVVPPDWFKTEWQEHMQKIMDKDTKFKQCSYQEVKMRRLKEEAFDDLNSQEKKAEIIVDTAIRRLHLHKEKDMMWAFNPALGRFTGRPKPQKEVV